MDPADNDSAAARLSGRTCGCTEAEIPTPRNAKPTSIPSGRPEADSESWHAPAMPATNKIPVKNNIFLIVYLYLVN